MIRLILRGPNESGQLLFFDESPVTLGRATDNHICLEDRGVSKYHGRIVATRVGYVYEDLGSTNGSTVLHGGETVPLTGKGTKAYALRSGDVIRIKPYTMELQAVEPALVDSEERGDVTVMLSRPCTDPVQLHEGLVSSDAGVAGLVLRLVRETSSLLKDERRLLDVIGDLVFQAFPQATHQAMLVRNGGDDELRALLVRSREGNVPRHLLSRTIIGRVLQENVSLMFSGGQGSLSASESIVAANIETAICVPLRGQDHPFGVMQLDIRSPGKGVFKNTDLDLLTLFASQVGLLLDNVRLYQEQQRALESTINALVRSLSLKDPDTAYHSERVRAISLLMGRELELSEEELEVLSVAAVLHDTGKHASPQELLRKPGSLTPDERRAMNEHASYTQSVLDMIRYPAHLRDVPRIAAYHHEKMNGTGTYGVGGEDIPLLSRVIAVADVFDALVTPRPYKPGKAFAEVLAILDADRDRLWDGQMIDAIERVSPEIARAVYRMDSFIVRMPELSRENKGERAA